MEEILAKKITFIEYGGDICQKRLHLSNMAEIFVKKDYIYRKWRRYLSKKITFNEYGGDICQKRLHLSNMAETFVKKDYIYRKWRRPCLEQAN